ncbi:MAG: S1 RNA-binding domain-containing protein [Patescibacteria group bacterium]
MNQQITDQDFSTMEKLLQDKNQPLLPKVGDLIKGKVISVSNSTVHLDIGGIVTGIVRGRELIDESGEFSTIKIGDEVQATVLEIENENGELELSFRSAGHQKAWNELQRMLASNDIIEVPVTEANRGGLMVKVGKVDGFIPVSQLIPEHYPRVEGGDKNKILEMLKKLIGQKLKAKIIDLDESDNKLIVSEKAAWENQQKAAVANYKTGDIVSGRVTGVVDFGAFIEFGEGLEGLVHISELAWQRIDNPREIIKVGDQIKAKIISIDGTKVSLSTKQLQNDPWKDVINKYRVGQVTSGKVLKINPFGAFVELDQAIHGLVHISELSEKKIAHPSEIIKEGEKYSFKILSIEPENHRLGLSLKATTKEAKISESKDIKKEPVPEEEKVAKDAKSKSEPESLPTAEKPAQKSKDEKKDIEKEKVKKSEKTKKADHPEKEEKKTTKPKKEKI